jgi:uncharacterized damage-inducible protein DinB
MFPFRGEVTPMPSFEQMIAHMGWANRLVLESLRGAEPLDPRLRELFGHILGAEHTWLTRLSGTPVTVAVWPKLTLDECQRLVEENHRHLAAYVAGLGPDGGNRSISYRNSAGDAFTSTAAEILTHLSMHGSYHRGQIAWGLRDGGQIPRSTDYIAFARGAPAASRTSSP